MTPQEIAEKYDVEVIETALKILEKQELDETTGGNFTPNGVVE